MTKSRMLGILFRRARGIQTISNLDGERKDDRQLATTAGIFRSTSSTRTSTRTTDASERGIFLRRDRSKEDIGRNKSQRRSAIGIFGSLAGGDLEFGLKFGLKDWLKKFGKKV